MKQSSKVALHQLNAGHVPRPPLLVPRSPALFNDAVSCNLCLGNRKQNLMGQPALAETLQQRYACIYMQHI